MKEWILLYLENFWVLLSSIAVFILIGVVIAGVFKLLLPDVFIKKHLGQPNFMSNIKAAILGIPLPLCSCSVIPFVSALRKSGASKSATQTFLIATPITGADSIIATYGVFGWVFTLFRLISSVIISLLAGALTLFFVNEKDDKVEPKKNDNIDLSSSFGKPVNSQLENPEGQGGIYQRIISYAFDEVYKDISKSLMIGVMLGALIVTFMPDNISEYISSNILLNYLIVLVISLPLYVCATASIPLGLSLLTAGFSPGAAFIFLTAGPATNMVTMSVVLKTLGQKSLIIYLLSVILGSIIFGVLFDYLFPSSLEQIDMLISDDQALGFIDQISSVILLYLSFKYIFSRKPKPANDCGGCGGGCS